MEWRYSDDRKRIIIDPPKQRLRITGHRVASVLGLNKYQSPFGAWVEIVKLAKLPFEETKYTKFGKVVEPKLIQYVSDKGFPNVLSIEDYYGNNIDQYRWNNFVDDSKIFGGIIDAVATKNDLKTLTMIVECKTSSHPEVWKNGNVPIDYLLQGGEYSWLKKLDRVLFVCTFPQPMDYNNPEMYEVNDDNTILVVKKLKDITVEMNDGKIITFEEAMEYCEDWWKKHIESGISPEFDEVNDKQYLDIIRTSKPANDNSLDELCESARILENDINEIREKNGLDSKEKELKSVKDAIKEKMMDMLKDGETKIEYNKYKVSGSVSNKFNAKKFQADHPKVYEDYCEESITYRFSESKIENNKKEGI